MRHPIALVLAIALVACAAPPRRQPRSAAVPAPIALTVHRAAPAIAIVAPVAAKETPVAPPRAPSPSPAPCAMAGLSLDRHKPFARGKTVLTFDDGPYADRTPALLDLLAEHAISATFFVLGRHVTRNTYALIQRMDREGHLVGSHSYDHDIDMARGPDGARAVRYIRGQHETTRVLIQMARLAQSRDHFEGMHRAVFGIGSDGRLGRDALTDDWPTFIERFDELRGDRTLPAVTFSRPPGGGPYLGRSTPLRARYDEALRTLGMTNVMWHAQSGDVHPTRARDRAFLEHNLVRGASRGGILLVHDFIRRDALAAALSALARRNVELLPLDTAARDSLGCSVSE